MEELEKIKKAKSFLIELRMLRESSEECLVLKDEKMKKGLFEAFCAAYNPSIKLKQIGFGKLEKIYNFMNALSKEHINMYPESTLQTDVIKRYSSSFFDRVEYDSISIGIKALQTYETLAPWLEEVNKCKIVKGLTKILENEKC